MSKSMRTRLSHLEPLALLACFALLLPAGLAASTHSLQNLTEQDKTLDFSCSTEGESGNGQCEANENRKVPKTVSNIGTVKAGEQVTLGGDSGGLGTKKCWFKSCTHKWICPTGKESTVKVDFGSMGQPRQTGVALPIWTPDDPGAEVWIFQSYLAPLRPALISNVDFEHEGYDEDGDPILIEAATGMPITDSNGQLFPEFRYEGPLHASGAIELLEEPLAGPEPITLVD